MIKKLLILIMMLSFAGVCFAASSTRVKGYRTKNGNYINSYRRTKADTTLRNNYSSKGNYNPYTGAKGSKKMKYSF